MCLKLNFIIQSAWCLTILFHDIYEKEMFTGKDISQRAKKVVSDSPGLVDFAIGLVKSVFNLPDGQVMFFEEFE